MQTINIVHVVLVSLLLTTYDWMYTILYSSTEDDFFKNIVELHHLILRDFSRLATSPFSKMFLSFSKQCLGHTWNDLYNNKYYQFWESLK